MKSTVNFIRFGSNMEMSVDEGDGMKQRSALFPANYDIQHEVDTPFTDQPAQQIPSMLPEPMVLLVHPQEGVLVGGVPVFDGTTASSVLSDLKNSE